MQVEITYHKGKLTFASPIKLKQEHLRLIAEIPDENIIIPSQKTTPFHYKLPAEVKAQAEAMEKELDSIRNAPYTTSEEEPALTSKQQERIEAFALRNEVRDAR
jgi:hypothetical protein